MKQAWCLVASSTEQPKDLMRQALWHRVLHRHIKDLRFGVGTED